MRALPSEFRWLWYLWPPEVVRYIVYLFKTEKWDAPPDKDYRFWRLHRAWCRHRRHPDGPVWYNPGGTEPDWHCRNCGDILG